MNGLSSHPFFQNLRPYVEGFHRAQAENRARASGDAGAANQPQPQPQQQQQPVYSDEDDNDDDDDAGGLDSFLPPVDVFNTDAAYILHVALPGAKKEDVGVDWDAEAGILRVAGVVHRPGDDVFQRSMTSAERRVGMFERSIPLPPPTVLHNQQQQQQQQQGEGQPQREEVDALGITARMEDGLLVVTVPKLEREWTEIRKVDIE
jgi:HSP20 family protein